VVSQLATQGALAVALVVALLANPRIIIRLNAYLLLLSVLAIASLAVSIHSEFLLGSTYRAVRLCLFVTCLWLLTPWWGRRDLLLLRCYRLCLWAALGLVALGAVIAPGKAFSFEGRLSGTIWPMPPTQVAHYGMVLFGTSVVLWMCHIITGRHALFGCVFSALVLLGTHTRTALLAGIIGLAVAAGSLFLRQARVRRTSVWAVGLAFGATILFASELTKWASRGQSAQEAAQLTGRTKVWSAAVEGSRAWPEELFGSGLSNKSFNGLPVDSSWVATYLDQGWFGIAVTASILLLLFGMAATRAPGIRRALALFLVVYCLVASITETGLGDASPYVLDLMVAAALLAPPARSAP
jgi:O-antigen ligase